MIRDQRETDFGRRQWWRGLCAALIVVGVSVAFLSARPALAQTATPANDAEVAKLVKTLEDPSARERLIGELKTLMAAEGAAKPANQSAAVAEPDIEPASKRPAKPASQSATVIKRMSDTLGRLATHVVELGRGIAALPDAAGWLGREWSNPERREVWYSFLWRLAAVIGGGVIASQLVFFALRRPRRVMEQRPRPRAYLRPPLLLSYNLLRLVPALCFVGAGYGLLALLDPSEVTRLIALTAINAHLIASIVKLVGYQGLAPWTPNLRVSGFRDDTAKFCARWWSRLVSLAVYGYFFCQGVLLLGLPVTGYNALTKVLGIVVIAIVAVLVVRIRPEVSAWLQRAAGNRKNTAIAMIGRRLAEIWHIMAIAYALAGGLVAAVAGITGFLYFLKSSAASFAIIWVAGFALAGIPKLWRGGVQLKEAVRTRDPGLASRLNRYLPTIRNALQVIVILAAGALILEAWNVDVLTWLASDVGALVFGRIAAIIAIIAIALLVWELVSTLIDRYLIKLEREGRVADERQRARTLLPLARNALRIVVSVVAALMVLAEIGIDIAPILAGVGVVGLAIGFGAQTLVKDVITGVFILLEDSLAVGDVVTVAGKTGVVESITIRTLRVRGLDGSVHTIPFSAIDTVSNLTKDFSYFVADIAVPYNTNTDRATEVMGQVIDEMRAEPEFEKLILEPMDVLGLDKFSDASVVIRARVKTAPSKQWVVGRNFNRRLKFAFEAYGIEFGTTGKSVVIMPDATPGGSDPKTPSREWRAPGRTA